MREKEYKATRKFICYLLLKISFIPLRREIVNKVSSLLTLKVHLMKNLFLRDLTRLDITMITQFYGQKLGATENTGQRRKFRADLTRPAFRTKALPG